MEVVRNSRIAMAAIYVNNLIKKFGDKTAVFIPDFCFPPDEIIGLVGNNGAGKTTLFRLILDLIKPDDGKITFAKGLTNEGDLIRNRQAELYSNKAEEWKSFVTAYLDEGFLIDFLTPKEFFTFIAKVKHISKQDMESQLQVFSQFLGTEILNQRKYIREYSAGNRQKIGIVAALFPQPELIILDEPFNFLDPTSQNNLKTILLNYQRQYHATVLVSSHNLHHMIDISNRIILMENGKIIRDITHVNQTTMSEIEDYFR